MLCQKGESRVLHCSFKDISIKCMIYSMQIKVDMEIIWSFMGFWHTSTYCHTVESVHFGSTYSVEALIKCQSKSILIYSENMSPLMTYVYAYLHYLMKECQFLVLSWFTTLGYILSLLQRSTLFSLSFLHVDFILFGDIIPVTWGRYRNTRLYTDSGLAPQFSRSWPWQQLHRLPHRLWGHKENRLSPP